MNAVEQIKNNAHFGDESMEIAIGRMTVYLLFGSNTIATKKDEVVVDRFVFEDEYTLANFLNYVKNVISSEKKLGDKVDD